MHECVISVYLDLRVGEVYEGLARDYIGKDDVASRFSYCSTTGHCSTGAGGKEK